MAGRADLSCDFLPGGTCLDAVATGTGNGYFMVFRVDSFFHLLPPDELQLVNKAAGLSNLKVGYYLTVM
jgi:hypothetical protein